MSLSTRLTRAGFVLLISGLLCTLLPANDMTYANTANCTSTNGASVALGVTAVAVTYGVASGLFLTGGNDRTKKGAELDDFVYNGGASAPAIFDRWGNMVYDGQGRSAIFDRWGNQVSKGKSAPSIFDRWGNMVYDGRRGQAIFDRWGNLVARSPGASSIFDRWGNLMTEPQGAPAIFDRWGNLSAKGQAAPAIFDRWGNMVYSTPVAPGIFDRWGNRVDQGPGAPAIFDRWGNWVYDEQSATAKLPASTPQTTGATSKSKAGKAGGENASPMPRDR